MIPNAHIQAWSASAPWPDLRQIEQDLIISRALCDLFSAQPLAGKLAFRGGTAINKLLFEQPLRYSEDIDLVQIETGGIGPTVDAIRDALAWLGRANVDRREHSTRLNYQYAPEADANARMRLKIEINGREHQALYGFKTYPFALENPWFTGRAAIRSFEPDELFGTKLRALLQRRKGRDLFDLDQGLRKLRLDPARLVACLEHYLALQENELTRANAEQIMLRKLEASLTEDITPLLPAGVGYTDDDARAAFETVWFSLIALIKGEAWKSSQEAIEALRKTYGAQLLAAKT